MKKEIEKKREREEEYIIFGVHVGALDAVLGVRPL